MNLGRTKVITRKRPLTETLSFLSCLNHLSSALTTSLRSGFRKRFIFHPFCSNVLIILVLSLQVIWIIEFTRQNSRHTSASFVYSPILYFCKHFNICFGAVNLLLVTVAMVSLYHSPFNCRSRKVVGSFRHRVNNLQYFHFSGLEFLHLPEVDKRLAFSRTWKYRILRLILKLITCNVVISR